MSVVLAPPTTLTAPSIFPLFGFESVPEGSLGDSINKATLKALDSVKAAFGIGGFEPQYSVESLDVVKPKNTATGGSPPAPSGGGGGQSDGSGAGDKVPGRPVRLSDFKTALKIGATGAAVTGAALGVNEGVKALGKTANDAVGTTGEVVKNISDSIGKGVENASQAVGDALSPLTDPLGLQDPQTRKNIGGLVIGLVVVGVIGFGIFMVMRK